MGAWAAVPVVLLTRPQGRNGNLVCHVEALGYRAVTNPLLEILPTGVTIPDETFDAVLFTSTSGVSCGPDPSRFPLLASLPAYTVGEQTAAAAHDRGWDSRMAGQHVVDMANYLKSALRQDQRLLHLSGTDLSHDLPTLLSPSGPKLAQIAVYSARKMPLQKVARDLLSEGAVAWILVFSQRTAEALAVSLDSLIDGRWTHSTGLLCLSHAVAEPLLGLPWRSVRIAERPSEAAMLSALPRAGDIL